METHIVIYITSGNEEETEKIAAGLVRKGLAACVNIVPSIKSVYKWEGNICNDNELLLIAKSRRSLMREIIEWVKRNHSYETPEIIALPIIEGSNDYLKWIDASCPDLLKKR